MSQELNKLSYIELRRLSTKEGLKVGSSPTKDFLVKTLSEHYKVAAEEVIEVEVVDFPKKDKTRTKIKVKVEAKVKETIESDIKSVKLLAEKVETTIERYLALIPQVFLKRIEKSIDKTIEKFDEILELEAEEVTDEQFISESANTKIVDKIEETLQVPVSQVATPTVSANKNLDDLFDDDELELELQQMSQNNTQPSNQYEEDEEDDDECDEDEDDNY